MSGSRLWSFVVFTSMAVGGAAASLAEWKLLTFILIGAGVLGMVWTVADSMWERHNEELDLRRELVTARTRFAATIGAADKETRSFLAREWPEMGLEFGEESLMYILRDGVNTQVLVHFLRVFLHDSTERAFVDVRNYNDDKYLQERFEVSREVVRAQWTFATEFLAKVGYLKRIVWRATAPGNGQAGIITRK